MRFLGGDMNTILETGFLSSPSDRQLLIGDPQRSAEGLAKGITDYLLAEGLIKT